jgi:hypothetical protein
VGGDWCTIKVNNSPFQISNKGEIMSKATWKEVGKVFLQATEGNRKPNFKGTINVEAIPEGT